ncbi:MAG: gliding motility-associated C-terminal domain-containing protein [Bacteroidia bacterium]|nr:gliding motility-associated C-terminal domain-containing protein [Bacteroidia bacterium]
MKKIALCLILLIAGIQGNAQISIDCNGSPVNTVYCYGNNDTMTWLFTSNDGSPLRISFNSGTIEGFFDDLTIYDGTDNTGAILFNNNADAIQDFTGLEFSSTGDSLFLEVDSDSSVSCQSGSRLEWNFDVACATCVNPSATYTVNEDCINGPQFFVDVDLTDLGSATSITITDNQGSAPQITSAIGLFTFGPFANNTNVVVTVTNDDDSNCILTSPTLTQDQCVLNSVDCTQPPLQFNYCYGNNDTTSWLFTSTDGSPVRLSFVSGTIEGFFDDLTIYDGPDNGSPILFNNNTDAIQDFSGLVFDSTGDSLFMEVDSDGSVSCQSGSRLEWDFNVSCATCANPVATYTVSEDCINGPQFFVDVDLTDLGSASSITISDNQGSPAQTTSAIGQFSFGPFLNNTNVVITVANDDDANCILTSPSLTQDQCVLNVVDCSVGPLDILYCYGNNDTTSWLFTSSDGSPLRIQFNSGTIEGFFDDLTIYDGADNTGTILFNNNDAAINDFAGLVFQSTGDSMFLEVDSDGSVSCQSGARLEWDFSVSCATCINPTANYLVVDDCDNGDQFLIDVNVTSLGDATSLTISDNQGSAPVQVTTTGITQFGPYPFLTDIIITISNDDDVNCIINSGPIQQLACPPDNDNCIDATSAVVNDDESCDLLTPGSIIAASDSGVSEGSCFGNPDDDVWYEFTALNNVQLISIINITDGTTNLDHAVYEGSCGSLVELYCSGDTASITPELVVGNTYFVRVFSAGSAEETSSFDLCIKEAPENTICENASNFCVDGGALIGTNVVGLPNDSSVACLGTIPNPSWNIIQIGDPGLIEIQIVQNTEFDTNGNPIGNGLDVDFVLWGPFDNQIDYCELDLLVDCPTCPNNTTNPNFYPFGNIVDCSYSPAPEESITIDNALSGEIYVLLVTNFSNQPGFIQIQQTNQGDAGAGSITAEIEADLGEDQELCGFADYTIFANSPFADVFEWYQNGIVIDGEISSSLTVTESDTYTLIVYDEQCDVTAQDEVTITFYQDANANPVNDIVTCDDPTGNDIEDFDLEAQTAGILGSQSPADFVVTYHESLADAQAGINALSSPYTNLSNPQTIYVRVEDVDAVGSTSGCFVTSTFDLVISGTTPTATSVDFELCDDITRDGVESFDLNSHSPNILNGQDDTIYTVTYHINQIDAESGTNPIASPYNNTSNPETLFARVESNQAVDCYDTTSFDLVVNDIPVTSFDPNFDFEVCPDATVPIQIVATGENYSDNEVSISWYLDGVIITGESSLTLPVLVAGEYTIEVTFDGTGCTGSNSVTVIELENCVIPQGISPNNDGFNDSFDLSSYDVHKLEIYNRNGTLVYSKSNYSNEWKGQSNDGKLLPVGTYFYVMRYQNNKERAAWIYVNY